MKHKLTDKEVMNLPRNARINHLTKMEKKVFDLLVECPDLRNTKYELVYEFYLKHIRFKDQNSFGDFEQDFIQGRVQVETINVAQRKCKRWFPELGPSNKKSWSEAAAAHLQHARNKTNPAQERFL
jgi:hypothetical protein